MSAWESTRTPSLRKSASCSIIALRNNSESPILSSSATVHSPSVDWSLLKEPHGGRLRQWPLPFTHSRGHYLTPCSSPKGSGLENAIKTVVSSDVKSDARKGKLSLCLLNSSVTDRMLLSINSSLFCACTPSTLKK